WLSRSFCRFGASGLDVFAGPSLRLPNVDTVAELKGNVTYQFIPGGAVAASVWEKVSGPGEVAFGDPASAVTTASFSEPGAYILSLSGLILAGDGVLAEKSRLLTVVVDQPSTVLSPSGLVALWKGEGNTLDSVSNYHGSES